MIPTTSKYLKPLWNEIYLELMNNARRKWAWAQASIGERVGMWASLGRGVGDGWPFPARGLCPWETPCRGIGKVFCFMKEGLMKREKKETVDAP